MPARRGFAPVPILWYDGSYQITMGRLTAPEEDAMKQLFDRMQLDWHKLPKVTRFAQYLLAISVCAYFILLVADGVPAAVYSLFGLMLVAALGAMMCLLDRHWSYAILDIGVAGVLYLITSLMNPQ